jgi:L-alanine-DL-glutamate epimerase-like enolase superfamily enzyme
MRCGLAGRLIALTQCLENAILSTAGTERHVAFIWRKSRSKSTADELYQLVTNKFLVGNCIKCVNEYLRPDDSSTHRLRWRPAIDGGTKPTDVFVTQVSVYMLPVLTRVPLKFGAETLTEVTCLRVRMTVCDQNGRQAEGWGETPLNVQWSWPSGLPYSYRLDLMKQLCVQIAESWVRCEAAGHPIELGYAFQLKVLPHLLRRANAVASNSNEDMPHLAALVAASAFDIALHDAYGVLHRQDIFRTYTRAYMNHDLATYLHADADTKADFVDKYPADFLAEVAPATLPVWHMVGGLDPIGHEDLNGDAPLNDGYPKVLTDWIHADGLTCLKVKLVGNDAEWDYRRLVRVGQVAEAAGVKHLSADFNCTVDHPIYVNDILDRLSEEHPTLYAMILYLEQPFPYDLESNPIDVRSISRRKLLFLDESADDWQSVQLGRSLGWTGVALKTCKSQTGALLALCWAKAHGMPVMVQDLTNPMLAHIPHVRLAAHADTLMGVEANAPQFYPDASSHEAEVHPGLYRRRNGKLDLSSIHGPGFGYRLDEIHRELPAPLSVFERGDSHRVDPRQEDLTAPAFASVFHRNGSTKGKRAKVEIAK